MSAPQARDEAVTPPSSYRAQISPSLSSLACPLSGLRPDPDNARLHPDRNLDAIKASLTAFGQQKPIVVARDGTVVAGNGTLAAAKALGWTHLACVTTDLDVDAARAFALADNRTAELAEWDTVQLAETLKNLPVTFTDAAGFDEREIARIARDADAAIRAAQALDEDAIPETPTDPVTRLGDLWLLGSHRLLCGDSTKPEDVARLMDGQRAQLLATDPPYLVNYQGGNHPDSTANRPDVKDKHWDDYVDPESGVAFFEAFLRAYLPHCTDNVAIYQWHASKRYALLETAWTRVGLLVHQQIIWAKARPVLTYSHYLWAHEPCAYGWVEGKPPLVKPPPSERTVWSIDQVGASESLHPTMKPVDVMARPIRFHTAPGDLVAEPFSGSGTQIVAAEQLDRRCYAMELAPAFVDVAVMRWERLTGRKAERVTS